VVLVDQLRHPVVARPTLDGQVFNRNQLLPPLRLLGMPNLRRQPPTLPPPPLRIQIFRPTSTTTRNMLNSFRNSNNNTQPPGQPGNSSSLDFLQSFKGRRTPW
jgi:hypothetical protein